MLKGPGGGGGGDFSKSMTSVKILGVKIMSDGKSIFHLPNGYTYFFFF